MAVSNFEELIIAIRKLSKGTIIPKPRAKTHKIVRWGQRQGGNALIYSIKESHEKGITMSEWHSAYNQLLNAGEFTKEWFNTAATMKRCSEEGDCNFTTIGGVFILIGLVDRPHAGRYSLKNKPRK